MRVSSVKILQLNSSNVCNVLFFCTWLAYAHTVLKILTKENLEIQFQVRFKSKLLPQAVLQLIFFSSCWVYLSLSFSSLFFALYSPSFNEEKMPKIQLVRAYVKAGVDFKLPPLSLSFSSHSIFSLSILKWAFLRERKNPFVQVNRLFLVNYFFYIWNLFHHFHLFFRQNRTNSLVFFCRLLLFYPA